MLVLKGLLFSVGTLVLLTVVSLLVVGIIKLVYKIVSRGQQKTTANSHGKEM